MKMQSLDFALASGQHNGSTSHKIGFFCGVTAERIHGFLRVVVPQTMGATLPAFKVCCDVRGVTTHDQAVLCAELRHLDSRLKPD